MKKCISLALIACLSCNLSLPTGATISKAEITTTEATVLSTSSTPDIMVSSNAAIITENSIEATPFRPLTEGERVVLKQNEDIILELHNSNTKPGYTWTVCGFSGTPEAKKIVIPEEYLGCKITHIGADSFESNELLEEVILPSSVTTIDNSAFSNCTNLSKINLNNVVTIKANAFYGCSSLQKLSISGALKTLENTSFALTNIKEIKLSSKNKNFILKNNILYNAKKTNLLLVSKAIKSVTLPKTIKTIPQGAFYNCSSLSSITLPSKLQTIKENAFRRCTKLKKITIPASVNQIGARAFAECYNIKNFSVSSKNKKYSYTTGILYNNSSLMELVNKNTKTLTIKKNTKKFPNYLYDDLNLSKICKISIKKGNTSFTTSNGVLYNKKKSKIFYCLNNLTKLVIPASVTSFDVNILRCNTKLKTVKVAAANKYYYSYNNAIYDKENNLQYVPVTQKKLKISKKARSLRYFIQKNIRNTEDKKTACSLQNITVQSGNKYLTAKNNLVYDKEMTTVIFASRSIKKLNIENTVKYIGEGAFYGCNQLESFTLPNHVIELRTDAFARCNKLNYVKLSNPENNTLRIEDYVFAKCDSLKWIYFPENTSYFVYELDEIYMNSKNLTDLYFANSKECVEESLDDYAPDDTYTINFYSYNPNIDDREFILHINRRNQAPVSLHYDANAPE